MAREPEPWGRRGTDSALASVPTEAPRPLGSLPSVRTSGTNGFGRLAVSNDGEQRQAVLIVGADGAHVRQLTPWRLNAEHPTWSPDSRWITFNSPEGTVEAMRPNGRDRHTILPASEGRGGHKTWFSPDGSRILFRGENQGLLADPPDDYNGDPRQAATTTAEPRWWQSRPARGIAVGPGRRRDARIDRTSD